MSIPKVLCIIQALDSPFIINILQPLEILKARGALEYTVMTEKESCMHDGLCHDAVLFFRNSSPALLRFQIFCKLSGKPVIYAIDDNFFELDHSELGAMNAARLNAHSRLISNSDLVLVYSNPMVERVKALNGNVIKTAPGGIDFSAFEGLLQNPGKKKIKLIYATSRYKNDILHELFLSAVKKILVEYKGLVEMDFWGFMPRDLEGIPGVNYTEKVGYGEYIRRLYTGGFDIGLAPLKDDIFHRSKTNTKFRDYGACRIAGIYSDVDVYSDCVADGETGLLVENNEGAWYEAIKRLIEEKQLREAIKNKADLYVRTNYDMNTTADKFYDVLISAIEKKDSTKAKVPINNGPAARFLDLKPPSILFITGAGNHVHELKELLKLYRYSLRLINVTLRPGFTISPWLRRSMAMSDAAVFLDIDQRNMRGQASQKLQDKIFSCDSGSIIPVMNEIDDIYFKQVLAGERPLAVTFSLKIFRRKFKFIGAFFRKTGLAGMERYFRKSVRDPLREFLKRRLA